MAIFMQLALLLAVCLAGEAVSAVLPVPVPSSVIGMVILFVLLCTGAVRHIHIDRISHFLLGNMAFFFMPAGVELSESVHLFSGNTIRLITVCTLTTLITFFVTVYTVTAVSRLAKRRKKQ